jgi:ATP-dependent DNA helicase Rep
LAPKGVKPDVLFGLRNLLSRAKNSGLSPEEALAAARSPRELEAATIYQLYQQRLAAFNAVDFDDLIRLPLRILESDEECRDTWRERLRYLLVDEYQDTNDAQYRLLKVLAGERGSFTCVGDDDQSIYAWRGANPENIEQLGKDWPSLRVIKLEQNYRCGKRILRAANTLIANNPHVHTKKLWSEKPNASRAWPPRWRKSTRCAGTTWRSCIAAISRRGRWKRRCVWRVCRITSLVRCPSSIARK